MVAVEVAGGGLHGALQAFQLHQEIEGLTPEATGRLPRRLQERGADARAPGVPLQGGQHGRIEAAHLQGAVKFQAVGLVAQAHQFVGQLIQLLVAEAAGAHQFDLLVDDPGIAHGGERQGGGQGPGRGPQAPRRVLRLRRRRGLGDAGALLVPPAARHLPGRGAHGEHRLVGRPELLVVAAAEQVFLVGLGQIRIGDGGGELAEARLERGAPLGRVQRLGVLIFAGEEGLGEGGGLGELGLERRRALLSQDVVCVLAAAIDGSTNLKLRPGFSSGSARGPCRRLARGAAC